MLLLFLLLPKIAAKHGTIGFKSRCTSFRSSTALGCTPPAISSCQCGTRMLIRKAANFSTTVAADTKARVTDYLKCRSRRRRSSAIHLPISAKTQQFGIWCFASYSSFIFKLSGSGVVAHQLIVADFIYTHSPDHQLVSPTKLGLLHIIPESLWLSLQSRADCDCLRGILSFRYLLQDSNNLRYETQKAIRLDTHARPSYLIW